MLTWLEDYYRKSGDNHIVVGEGVSVAVTGHGFCTYAKDNIEQDVLFVFNCYGNGKYWEQFLKEKAKELGCKKIRFATKRNPKAFERRFGAKLVGYILEVEVD